MPDKEKSDPKKRAGAPEEELEGEFELKKLKKPTYVFAMLLSGVGILIALILAFVINDALDKTETAIKANLDGIYKMVADLEGTMATVEGEVGALNTTFDDLNGSMSTLADGIGGTGTTVKQFGATLSQINIPGFSLAQYGSELSDSGDELLNGSAQLKKVGALSEHREKLGELETSLSSIKEDLAKQKTQISQTKSSISEVFGLIKLANILVFVMFVVMFGVLILNSAAGIF